MTAKLKKMGYILCIGAVLVFLGSIGIYHSGDGLENIFKTLLILVLSVFLGILSVICKKSFKLDKFDDFVLGVSFATLVAAFMTIGKFALVGEWFSYTGDGVKIFLASIFILIGLLSLIMYLKTKVFTFIEIAVICLILSIFYIIYHITGDVSIGLISANTMLLCANIFSLFTKKISAFSIITYLSFIFVLEFNQSTLVCDALIFNVLTLASIIVILRKQRESLSNICPLIFGFINLILLISSIAAMNIGTEASVVLYVLIASIYDIATSVLKVNTKKATQILHKSFMNLIYFVAFVFSYDLEIMLIFVPLIILVVSCIQSYVLTDEMEKYFIVYKIFALILWIVLFVIDNVDMDLYFFGFGLLNLAMLVVYYLTKIKHVKINSLVLLSITLLLMIGVETISLASFIVGLVVIAIDYIIIFFTNEKDQSNALIRTFFIVSLFYSLLLVARVDLDNYKYLIASVFYFVLYLLSSEDKLKAGFSVGFIIGSLLLFVFSMNDSPIVLQNLVLFGGVFAFAFTVIEKDNTRDTFIDISTSILIIFGLLISMFPENVSYATSSINMPLLLAVLLESVGLLLYSITSNNKYLFYSSLVYTVIAIIELLVSIDGIPTAVVVTLSGIIVISVVLVMIKKYMADEHEKDLQEEKERKEFLANSIFCGTCGNRVSKDAVYCGKCGKLIKSKISFCGKCGAKLDKESKECPECGDKVDK